MPYKVFSDGDRFCVHKLDADDGKGKQIGCHDTREDAMAQMRALYASENKELFMVGIETLLDQEMDTKEREESLLAMFSEYEDRQKVAGRADVTAIKRRIIAAWKKKIDPQGPPAAQKSLVDLALKKLAELVDMVKSIGADEPESDMLIFKGDDDRHRWVARYSNNFRDDDNPPEIISEKSHIRFVELVEKGLAPLPDLLLWHRKEWNIGKADWVAYDNGFALAGGHFYSDLDDVAESLSRVKGISMSHGMPVSTIKRDPDDPTIIIEHETREITGLHHRAAANKLTGFVVIDEEEDMNSKDRQKLSEWGLSDEQIERIESMNLEDAAKAVEEGRETKEVEGEAPPVTDAETAQAQTDVESQETDTDAEVDVAAEFDKALQKALQPLFERQSAFEKSVSDALEAIKADITEVKAADEAKVAKIANQTPWASLQSMLGQRVESVIGREETKIDGRTSLAKGKPEETPPLTEGRTLVPFVNDLLAPKAS